MSRKLITSNRIRRKSHKKTKHAPSVNKYAHLVPKRKNEYDPNDKTYRDLPIIGAAGETIKTGFRCTFHGRLYALMEDTVIPHTAPPTLGNVARDKREAVGRFRLVAYVD